MATGVMTSAALIIVSLSMLDMVQDMVGPQLEKSQHFDARVILQGVGSDQLQQVQSQGFEVSTGSLEELGVELIRCLEPR